MTKRIPKGATLRELLVDCGKCDRMHGPYVYAEWKVQGRVVTAYVGKKK